MGLSRFSVLTCDPSVNHPEDSKSWEPMNKIKEDILRRMDSFLCPVKICCVKFLQRVVLVQTPGLISDPRVSSAIQILCYKNVLTFYFLCSDQNKTKLL